MNTAEDAVFDIRVGFAQLTQQQLGFLPFGGTAAAGADGQALGHAAGALNEFQVVVAAPGENILLADAVQRADQRHAGEVRAVQFGGHRLQLRAVEHAHDGGFNDVVEVVPQCNFVAAELLCFFVQMSPPHTGAEVAGVLFGLVGHIKNVGFKHRDGDVHQGGVSLDLLAVDLVVAGVHHKELQLIGNLAVALQFLHQLCHQHGILAARNADGDFVPRLDQFVPFDRHNKGRPQLLAIFFDDAALDFLTFVHLAFHGQVLLA